MKMVLSPIAAWPHDDVASCLMTCIATVLARHGHDPRLVLGANWDFYYPPGDFRREEYYYPCRFADLARCIMPYHPLSSRWHLPASAAAGEAEVKDATRRGTPALVAVDNYYLHFRPAHRDVHAAHLVVVYGFDEEAGAMYVLDSTPPGYNGPLDAGELRAARGSGNPLDDRDTFFATAPVAHRWLEIEVNGPFPALTREWVAGVVDQNLRRFREAPPGPAFSGQDGLRRYLDDLCARAATESGDGAALEELYVVGWAVQGTTALHAAFLMTAGRLLGWDRLSEAGRRVDRLAHHWTALRMMGAHGLKAPQDMAPRLRHRAALLLGDQEQALLELQWLLRRG